MTEIQEHPRKLITMQDIEDLKRALDNSPPPKRIYFTIQYKRITLPKFGTKKHKLKITNRVAKVLGMRGVLLTRAGSLLISPLFVRQK